MNLHIQIQYFNDNGRVRGHNLKIHIELVNTPNNCKYNTIRHNFFTNTVANDWNVLTQETIDSSSVNQFKNQIDKQFKFYNLILKQINLFILN